MSRAERGVTLLELLIAVMLVGIISLGLLYAMRTALTAYQKINTRLESDRRAMGMQQALVRQIGGVMPVPVTCAGNRLAMFLGTPDSARFVSSYSLSEGARGYPRVVQYQVLPDSQGGVRLMMDELPYQGPAAFCAGNLLAPVQLGPQAVEIAGPLAFCRFSYREPVPDSTGAGAWFELWMKPDLPRVVRLDMASLHPNPVELPAVSLNVPIHITRQIGVPYVDF